MFKPGDKVRLRDDVDNRDYCHSQRYPSNTVGSVGVVTEVTFLLVVGGVPGPMLARRFDLVDGVEKRHGFTANETPEHARIRALESQLISDAEVWRKGLREAEQRACRLSDATGALRTERDELLRENAVLRRRVEQLERRAGSQTGGHTK